MKSLASNRCQPGHTDRPSPYHPPPPLDRATIAGVRSPARGGSMDQGRISRESFAPPEPSKLTPWLVASAAALSVLGSALILMKISGLLNIPKDDTGAKTLAASLGLIGATLSAAVTLVGTVVKYSIDDRNARLAAVQAGHNYALALDAEKRNRIEAAIRCRRPAQREQHGLDAASDRRLASRVGEPRGARPCPRPAEPALASRPGLCIGRPDRAVAGAPPEPVNKNETGGSRV